MLSITSSESILGLFSFDMMGLDVGVFYNQSQHRSGEQRQEGDVSADVPCKLRCEGVMSPDLRRWRDLEN